MTLGPGLLALLHPDGIAERSVVFGAACPERLRPAAQETSPPWDLAVVAPSREEARSPRWLAATAGGIAAGLRPEAVVYLIGPPRARRRLARAFARVELRAVVSVLHLPDLARSETLVPLERASMRVALDALAVPGSATGRVARLAVASPGSLAAVARFHGAVGLVLRRPGGRPLAGWLGRAAGGTGPRLGMVRTRWRKDRVRTVVQLLPASRPDGEFVKLSLRSEAETGVQREAAALADLADAARAAGALVPTATVLRLSPSSPALVLNALPGRTARALIAGEPGRHDEVLEVLLTWLERWSRATRRMERLEPGVLDAWVLAPARRLADGFDDAAGYMEWLEARCREVEGRTVPLVATHNDLTMTNVLLPDDGGLGVIDWEVATRDGLPLRDFLYAAVDAAAARDRYRDRPAAFEQCFASQPTGVVGLGLERLRRAIGVEAGFATVGFHACWLQHAEDERRKRAPGEALPFLECARRAARLRWQA